MASYSPGRQQTRQRVYIPNVFKNFGGRYKRIRRRVKGSPAPVMYAHKKEQLRELEELSGQELIDLFYGDQTHVCSEGYVPYGWQFPQEDVHIVAQKGFKINCWGLISRQNSLYWATTQQRITARFVGEQLDRLSFTIHRLTVVVLDNARIHTARYIQKMRPIWEARGLYLFFLPAYCPHLNLAETLWRHLKGGWLKPEDYSTNDDLAYALNRCLANVGRELTINFSAFNAN